MNKPILELLLKYQKWLKQGEENVRHLITISERENHTLEKQRTINHIWNIVIKDLQDLNEKMNHDHKQNSPSSPYRGPGSE